MKTEGWKLMCWRESYTKEERGHRGPREILNGRLWEKAFADSTREQGRDPGIKSGPYSSPMRIWVEGEDSAFLPKATRPAPVDPAKKRLFLFLGRLRTSMAGGNACSRT